MRPQVLHYCQIENWKKQVLAHWYRSITWYLMNCSGSVNLSNSVLNRPNVPSHAHSPGFSSVRTFSTLLFEAQLVIIHLVKLVMQYLLQSSAWWSLLSELPAYTFTGSSNNISNDTITPIIVQNLNIPIKKEISINLLHSQGDFSEVLILKLIPRVQ